MGYVAFEAIAQELRKEIADGTYPVGTSLPSERELSARFAVSVGTVRVALKELVHEGAVDGVRGRPKTVIQMPRGPGSFGSFRSFAQWAVEQGKDPGGRIAELAWIIASDSDCELLRVPSGSRVLSVLRLRTLDGEIVMLESSHYPEWLGEIVEAIPAETASVTSVLAEEHDVHFSHAEHRFGAEAAKERDAGLLGIDVGAPILVHRRISRDSHGVPLEWSTDRYVSGKVMLTAGSSVRHTPLQWAVVNDDGS